MGAPSELTILKIVLAVLIPAVIGLVLTGWAGRALRKRGSSPVAVRTLRVLITVAWVTVAALGVYATIGPVAALSALTFSALAGLAVTLALQTTLQNMIDGFILLQRRFLRLGDVIQLSGIKGTVVDIGLVEVVLRLEGGALATVSNATLLNGPMINFTASARLTGEY